MINIFIAYSHKDIDFKNDLKKFLTPLKRERKISIWDDFNIEAGEDWNEKIKENLYSAKIVILLVSPDSLASDYFYEEEFAISLERHKKGQVIITPVILRHCDLESTPLKSLEFLPYKGKPIVDWPTTDHAWKDVIDRIKLIIHKIEGSDIKKQSGNNDKIVENTDLEAIQPLYSVDAEQEKPDSLFLLKKDFEEYIIVKRDRIRDCREKIYKNIKLMYEILEDIAHRQKQIENDKKVGYEVNFFEIRKLKNNKNKVETDLGGYHGKHNTLSYIDQKIERLASEVRDNEWSESAIRRAKNTIDSDMKNSAFVFTDYEPPSNDVGGIFEFFK
jgi:hypothetical protein